MIELPKVRLAQPADAEDLYVMLTQEMWIEGGLFPISERKVREAIRIGIERRCDDRSLGVIGVIGELGHIEASIGLVASQFWYTDVWHIEDIWSFVRPAFRKSRRAKALLEFSKRAQQSLNIPLVAGVLSDIRTEQKVALYERCFGKAAGAVFVWPSMTTIKQQIKAA